MHAYWLTVIKTNKQTNKQNYDMYTINDMYLLFSLKIGLFHNTVFFFFL